jgi:hypothetical protein
LTFSAWRLVALRGAYCLIEGRESASVGALAAPCSRPPHGLSPGVVSGALPLVEAMLVGFVGI